MAKIIDFKKYLERKKERLKEKDIFATFDEMLKKLWDLQFNPPPNPFKK